MEFLSSYCASNSAKSWIAGLRPGYATDDIQSLSKEFISLRELDGAIPSASFDSPDELLRKVQPNAAILDPDDFLTLRRLLATAQDIKQFLHKDCSDFNTAYDLGYHMPELKELIDEINKVFSRDASIQDKASNELYKIRKSILHAQQKIRRRLEILLKDTTLSEVNQDPHTVIRNGRYVIPIRRELKSRFKGIIHDQSNSGRTLFIEPAELVEDGNFLSTLYLEERDEIRRILLELSDEVRKDYSDIQIITSSLCSYDVAAAISKWAIDYQCNFIEAGKTLHLKNARHPLLAKQFREDKLEDTLVPLNLKLGNDKYVMVVTGSNMGGKTVILKTIGLLSMIAQCGLPIPVDSGSELIYFPQILADIGDEQSLQQNLSTFTGHLNNIKDILDASCDEESLILLDELGSGTDPAEGGALACSVLDFLAQKGNLVCVTTHISSIKHYVHANPHMENASVLFNVETLTPTYTLELGRPGASHAISIAANIGIPQRILSRAKDLINSDELKLEFLLSEMDGDQQKIKSELLDAQRLRDTVLAEQEALNAELNDLKKERKKMLNEAQREAAAIVDNTRQQMERLLKQSGNELTTEQKNKMRSKLSKKQQNINQTIDESTATPELPLDINTIETGQWVWVEALNGHGNIVAISDNRKRVKIDVDGMTFEVKSKELGQPKKEKLKAKTIDESVATLKPSSAPVKMELNLVGKHIEEALGSLDAYLDKASLAGLNQLRIVHGFGTGTLRDSIHDFLSVSPLVTSYQLGHMEHDQGGQGVTIIELK